jgi:hypothetical protein
MTDLVVDGSIYNEGWYHILDTDQSTWIIGLKVSNTAPSTDVHFIPDFSTQSGGASNVYFGYGSDWGSYNWMNGTNNVMRVTSSGVLTSKNNTLDDASGNTTITGALTVDGVMNSQVSGHAPVAGSNAGMILDCWTPSHGDGLGIQSGGIWLKYDDSFNIYNDNGTTLLEAVHLDNLGNTTIAGSYSSSVSSSAPGHHNSAGLKVDLWPAAHSDGIGMQNGGMWLKYGGIFDIYYDSDSGNPAPYSVLHFDDSGTMTVAKWTIHKNDVECYGFYGTDTDPEKQAGGGAISMGSAFTSPSTPPEINLTDAQLNIPAYSSVPSPRRMRDVYKNTTNSTYYVHNGTTWIAFQGPTSSRPSSAYIGQFYIDTTTHQILVNTNTATPVPNTAHWDDTTEGYESEIGPYMGSNFSGFDTLLLLKGSPRDGDGTYQNKTANKTANLYLGNLYATGTIYYHSGAPTSFDSMDDLSVLKEIKSTTDDRGNKIIDPETINHLRTDGGFYDTAKMDGWHISVQKKLLERIEALEEKLSAIASEA